MKKLGFLTASVLAFSVLTAAGAASATVVNLNDVLNGGAVYTLDPTSSNPNLVPIDGFSFSVPFHGNMGGVDYTFALGDTFDYTFTVQNATSGAVQLQATAGSGVKFGLFNSSNVLVNPVAAQGTGATVVAGFVVGAAGSTGLYTVTNGTYHVELTPSTADTYTGSISVSAAPEPAAWAMMIIGVGGIGGVLRTRRRSVAAV